jgi:glycine cleavage system H protein
VADIKFTNEHEWVSIQGDEGAVGISPYAQEQLGDIVFVELPEQGRLLEKGCEAAVVESVKAASEVYAPISGEVIKTNPAIEEEPGLVNADALGQGWFFKIRIKDPSELDSLMDEAAYGAYVKSLG